MMSYQEFQEYIKDHILEGWLPEEDYEVSIQTITKNNGYQLECLSVRPYSEDERLKIFPVVYLESFYHQYLEGVSLNSLIPCIRDCYNADRAANPDDFSIPDDYEHVRSQLVYRLVNYNLNREMLETCPHVRIADLALTFRWIVSSDGPGLASALVSDEMFSWWDISKEELIQVAAENTSRLFPPVLRRLSDLVSDFCSEENGEQGFFGFNPYHTDDSDCDRKEVFVLSNDVGINGASAMLYENVLKDYSDMVDSDVYILPSSIHEVILVPGSLVKDSVWLYKMVSEANRSVVDECDYLSDSVYYYDRNSDQIRLAQCGD